MFRSCRWRCTRKREVLSESRMRGAIGKLNQPPCRRSQARRSSRASPRAARGKLLRVHRDHQLLVEFAGEHDVGLPRVFDIQIAPIGTEHLACCAADDHHVRPGLDPMLVRVPFGMCADLARKEFHFMVTERGADTPRSAGYATIYRCFRGDISRELTMTKSILVSLAILTLSTSAALAAHRTHRRHAIHSPAMNAFAGVGASPVVWTGFY